MRNNPDFEEYSRGAGMDNTAEMIAARSGNPSFMTSVCPALLKDTGYGIFLTQQKTLETTLTTICPMMNWQRTIISLPKMRRTARRKPEVPVFHAA